MRVPSPAGDIDEVIAQLDAVVDDARDEGSRLGFFAALYRRVTRRVARGIAAGEFDDGPRMDRLDTDFANRYFAALSDRLAGVRTPKAWRVAFDAADDDSALALQHLLLGINAHINVDLGAAAAAIDVGGAIDELRSDFYRINELLAEATDDVEAQLVRVSPCIGDLDSLAGESDERLAVFSIEAARDDAWRLATTLAAAPAWMRPFVSGLADEKAAFIGRVVADPPHPARDVVAFVRAAEEHDVRRVLDVLAEE